MSNKNLFLLDAYALIYRAYYAFIKNPRINSKGLNTSAIFGFLNTLSEVLNKNKPQFIGVVFDPKGNTFRHDMYPEYKANRESTPEDIRLSIPYIKELINAFNIPVIEVEKFEADDVIGTLSRLAENKGYKVFMMTPDKDYAQLVTENVSVLKPARGGSQAEIWDINKVIEKFKVKPNQIIDLLGLMGDSSDNIPGCPGIGPKSAEKLISEYGSIEGIYKNINKLKGKQKANLIEFKEQVLLSKKLATIEVNVPIELDEDLLKIKNINKEQITKLFNDLEFNTLLNRILGNSQSPKKSNSPIQGSLFDMSEDEIKIPQSNFNKLDNKTTKYIIVDTTEDINNLVKDILKEKEVCFDTETTSLEIHSANIVGLSISFKKNEAYYIPFNQNFEESKIKLELFNPFFENTNIIKVGQNLKYDIMVLMNYGIKVKGDMFDTMIAHYLIHPEQRHSLDSMALHYLNYETIKTEELIGKKGKNQLSMTQVDIKKICDYACEDADITLQLVPFIKEQLTKYSMTELFNTIEIPLMKVLANMEYEGIRIDAIKLVEYSKQLTEDMLKIEQRIYNQAGTQFNISSPKQLGEILFDKMKIVSNPTKTKTKQYSTGEEVLSKLKDKHNIINDILEYRSLKKLITTYIDALPSLIHKKTGKVHTSYNQTVTTTGRLSSNKPNLQNIPIRDSRGREIRKSFIPSDNNHILLAADYSQIELRIMAHLCEDENMIKAFNNNEDIHTDTASHIFKIDKSEVTRTQRGLAKGANFGIIYGISAFGLSQNLNIPRNEAKNIIDNYFNSYPKIKVFIDECIKTVREKGYTETLFGRRRYLPDINSNNAIVRSSAERNAINTPIQGTAADIIKIAMKNIQIAFDKENISSKMILQVHDELVFDVLKTELDKVKNIIKFEMENTIMLKIPLTIDMGEGNNWLEAH